MADFRRGLQNSKRVGFWKIEVYYIGITRGYYDRFSRPLSELPDLWLEASGNELFSGCAVLRVRGWLMFGFRVSGIWASSG